jgi:hypothetical protein
MIPDSQLYECANCESKDGLIKEIRTSNALLLVQIDKMDTVISEQRELITQLKEKLLGRL